MPKLNTEEIPITIKPMPVTAGETISIRYNGHLKEMDPDKIYVHMGYGSYYEWKDVKDVPMKKTSRGWETEFRIDYSRRLNLCFKDSKNNWDNNNGLNWSFEIHNGAQ